MNWRAVRAIARKDLKAALRNRMVVMPIVLMPLIFLIGLPLGAAFLGPAIVSSDADFQRMLDNAPAAMQRDLARFAPEDRGVALLLLYTFTPFYLMLPLMVVHSIAADAIAGERERKTLEALVYTPTTDAELLLGKLAAAFVPGVAVAWGGFVVYGISANVGAWMSVGAIVFPNWTWVVVAVWLAPAVAAFGLGVMVIVSARAETQQGAYQTGGFVVIPILLLFVGQASGVLVLGVWSAIVMGAALWALDVALLMFGRRYLRRDRLLARL